MSKSIIPEVVETSDLTDFERSQIEQWVEEGKPGISTLNDETLARAMELYISGKGYRDISQICNTKKVFVMYLSERYKWFTMKMGILDEMDRTMKQRLEEAKLRSTDFMLKMQHALQKKMGKNIDKYLATDNEEYLNAIDKEQFSKLMKVYEALHRGDAPKSGSGVNINLNMSGANISKAADGSVDITNSKEKSVAAKLKEMADARRAEERQLIQGSDINMNKLEGDPK